MSSVRRPTSRPAIRVYSLTVQRTARGGRGSRLRLAISVILAPGQADLAAQLLEHHVVARGDRRLALAHPGQLLLAEWRVFLLRRATVRIPTTRPQPPRRAGRPARAVRLS